MDPILPNRTMKVYQLIKQSGLSFSNVAATSPLQLGCGFFPTLHEAEHNRTMEILRETTSSSPKSRFHIFELEVPNPAYQE